MSNDKPRRLPVHAAAAVAGVTTVALGCSSAEDAINNLVEDNVTLEDTLGQSDDVNLDIPETSTSELAGMSIQFQFMNDNEVLAIAPPGISGGDSRNVADVTSDLFDGRFTAEVTFTGGFLMGETLRAEVNVNDDNATITLTLGDEVVTSVEEF